MDGSRTGWDLVSHGQLFTQILGSASTSLTFALSTISGELESSIFPRAWKKAEVVPHLKEGDHEVPDNNRPISLLPVLSKVAEKHVLQQCTSFLSDKNCLTKHQSGNKRYHSTETLSLLVTDHLSNAIDEMKVTAMVLIDLSKAFDSICHSILLNRLQALGKSTNTLRWFQSYLTERKETTRVGISTSSPLTVTPRVPQGSISRPVLFSLYMNDFDSHLSFNDHIDYLSSSLLGKLCQMSRVGHLFTKDVLLFILNSLVFCKLFYYSTVWSGATQQNIRKLKLLQNFAARILTNKRKYDHISPSLKDGANYFKGFFPRFTIMQEM